jgi:hypothetical protein
MNTVLCQECHAVFIVLLTFGCEMLPTVKFYTELIIMTIKIENIGTNRLLTSELETEQLAAAEDAPEQLFLHRSDSFATCARNREIQGPKGLSWSPHPSPLPEGEGSCIAACANAALTCST